MNNFLIAHSFIYCTACLVLHTVTETSKQDLCLCIFLCLDTETGSRMASGRQYSPPMFRPTGKFPSSIWLSTGLRDTHSCWNTTQHDTIESLQSKNPHKAKSIPLRQNLDRNWTLGTLVLSAALLCWIELYHRGVPVIVSTLCSKQQVGRGIICFLVSLSCCSCY